MDTIIGASNILNILIIGASFFLVLALWLGGMLIWRLRAVRGTKQLQRRLDLTEIDETHNRELRIWHDGQEAVTVVPVHTDKRTWFAKLNLIGVNAGLKVPAKILLPAVMGVSLVAALVAYVMSYNWVLALGVAVVIPIGFRIWLSQRTSKQLALFEKQLVDALAVAARSLRAGHPLIGALQLVSEEIEDPVRTTFDQICKQQELGVRMEDAIRQVASVSQSNDMKLFATAVTIQLRSGGNLADLMDSLASVIRDRIKLHRRVRVLTAQTQFSKRVLAAMPFVMFFFLNILNPRYMEPLYSTTLGRIMLGSMVLIVGIGVWFMNKLCVLHY